MRSRGTILAVILAAVFCCAALGAPAHADAQAQRSLEYSVKANYLVRFAAFVEWPAGAFADARSPVVICVLGRDPFGQTLDQAAASQTAYGRSLVVRRPTTAEAAAACHILYVGQAGAELASALDALPGRLMVTDTSVTARRGMIHFAISENRVRFHIDQAAATRSRLVLSSRLLNLALSVQGR